MDQEVYNPADKKLFQIRAILQPVTEICTSMFAAAALKDDEDARTTTKQGGNYSGVCWVLKHLPGNKM